MKEYECVQVTHHKDVAPMIRMENGWHLHTYQTAGSQGTVNHYLLFEKGK
jgi:hypothetical protein